MIGSRSKVPRYLKSIIELQEVFSLLSKEYYDACLIQIKRSDFLTNEDRIREFSHEVLNCFLNFSSDIELLAKIICELHSFIKDKHLRNILEGALISEFLFSEDDLIILITRAVLLYHLVKKGVFSKDNMVNMLKKINSGLDSNEMTILYTLSFFEFITKIIDDKEFLDEISAKVIKEIKYKNITNILSDVVDNKLSVEEIFTDKFRVGTLEFYIVKCDYDNFIKNFKDEDFENMYFLCEFEPSITPSYSLISLAAFYKSEKIFDFLFHKFGIENLEKKFIFWSNLPNLLNYFKPKLSEISNCLYEGIRYFRFQNFFLILTELKLSKSDALLCAFSAAKYNCVMYLIYFFEQITDKNVINDDGMTLFTYACSRNHVSLVKYFIRRKDIDYKFNTSSLIDSPLICACKMNNVYIAKILINHELCDVNEKDDLSNTPLMYSILNDNNVLFDLLISIKEININLKNLDGFSPILQAAMNNNEHAVKRLVMRHELEINAKNKDGCTALSYACQNDNFEIIKLLLSSSSIDIDTRGPSGFSIFHLSIFKDDLRLFYLLIKDQRTDINIRDKDQNTPLILSCVRNNIDVVECLLESDKININAKGINGNTALFTCATFNRLSVAKLLIKQPKININLRNDINQTPLHEACDKKHPEFVTFLIEQKGIKPNEIDDNIQTPLTLAAMKDDEATVKAIAYAKGVDVNLSSHEIVSPLSTSIIHGCNNSFSVLLNHDKVDVNLPSGKDQFAPIMYAVVNKRPSMIKELRNSNKLSPIYAPGSSCPWLFDAADGDETVYNALLDIGLTR